MITLHPSFLEYDGKKAFVVLPYEEFQKLEEVIEDMEDLEILQTAQLEEADAPTISLADAKKLVGL